MNFKITNGSVEYGAETILEEINIEIKEKEKIAIIGRNGAGKSTLLKAIINNDLLTQGTGEEKFNIYKEGNPVIGYLKQMEFEDDQITMIDEILKVYKPITNLEQKIEQIVEKMQTDKSEELAKEYSKAMDRYEFLDGYTYKKEYETAINKFGFSSEDKLKKISEFSGGQRTKIAFIKLLLSKPDILLLDEPTNHLDIETIEWLEQYLKNYSKSVVIVSHDRMFLNKIVNKVYEIEYGVTTAYSGNYTFFEEQKKINYEKQLKDYEYQQKEIKRLNDIVTRFKYKPTKAKMAMSKLKQIERMVKIEAPNKYDLTTFKTNFIIEKQSGKDVLFAKDLEIGYDKTLQKISLNVYRGQKIGIIGENGIGKSTVFKLIVGLLPCEYGNLTVGNVNPTDFCDSVFPKALFYLPQEDITFDFTPYDLCKMIDGKLLPTFLEVSKRFNLTDRQINETKISDLSGGERKKVFLTLAFVINPGILLLDEPTNSLDEIGKIALVDLLQQRESGALIITHDQLFDSIADYIYRISNGRITYEKDE